ncbi:nitrilase-related carbon-nitrogen hydrolase [Microbacterium halotolerans]|uniref:nitrilase-related carbon-nitrogen hydrolase n=1 Tax=Microbacterium halotolerans TaxID=246613 RepID=UPI000E6A97B7|nr:nitrilase-related carbon-nitrogen hydrolase [Microbacterium halotolerans]
MSATAVTVACVQTDPVIGDVAANTDATVTAVAEAADVGASLVVLPECASAGWAFRDADEARASAQSLEGGATVDAWRQVAAERDVWVCGGFSELGQDGEVYNSSVLIGPHGVASLYRKVHLWNTEADAFTPGDLGFPVVDTPFGRMGMIICYDAWIPESMRSCALAGADIVLAPSDWVPNPRQDPALPPLAHVVTMAGAHQNQLYVAAASRVGAERGQNFIGSSIVIDPFGWPLATGGDEVGMVLAEIDPIGSRPARRNDPFNRPLADRRPDQYTIDTPAEEQS